MKRMKMYKITEYQPVFTEEEADQLNITVLVPGMNIDDIKEG